MPVAAGVAAAFRCCVPLPPERIAEGEAVEGDAVVVFCARSVAFLSVDDDDGDDDDDVESSLSLS